MIFRKVVKRKRLDTRTRKVRAIAHHLIRWDVMREREDARRWGDAFVQVLADQRGRRDADTA